MNEKLFGKNFLLILLGQSISMFGTAILKFSLTLYILDITGSGAIFGIITAISTVPTILLSPIGGIVADRMNRKKVMVFLDFLYALTALLLYFILMVNQTVVLLGVVLVLLSIIASFETPVVQSSIPMIHAEKNYIKANAAVSQIAMFAGLFGPILAGMLYGFADIRPIILASSACFFAACIVEFFIKIPYQKMQRANNLITIVREDTKSSLAFLVKKQPIVIKMCMLVALLNLVISSFCVVGAPYIIRITLGLSSELNGLAEGIMAGAGIMGAITAGLLSSKLKLRSLYVIFVLMGVTILPLGIVMLLGLSALPIYWILVACLAMLQIYASIISIYLLSAIQQKTPKEMIGKIMAYIITIATCMMPLGQLVYGVILDVFKNQIFVVVFVAAVLSVLLGFSTKKILALFGQDLQGEEEQQLTVL